MITMDVSIIQQDTTVKTLKASDSSLFGSRGDDMDVLGFWKV